MKKLLTLGLLLLIFNASSQQKYQSLLWKISHDSLPKDSYLYGTMHVSGKIAFNLDDVFYKSLLETDIVALESDPTTWLEDSFELFSSNLYSGLDNYGGLYDSDDFYEKRFSLEQPKYQSIRSFIRFDNSIINNFLYRENQGLDNFEEDTYLDMFIYQAGKKQEKDVVSLENFKESMLLTTKASFNPMKEKMDTWLQKRYKKEPGFLLQQNAYRNRNLDLIDSIGVASNTKQYRKYMLFIRNENMVEVLDSVLKTKTVFAGVGAAHLPGENGMIELLRNKGYTVTPLKSIKSVYGKTIKKELEETVIKPELVEQSTKDGFLSIKTFGKLQELNFFNQKYYVATDMTNGGFLAVTRISTFDFLSKNEKDFLKEINDLLYEDIPGQIIEKEMISHPFPGIKVLNKTKKNDYQRYVIYKTPLEIIIVKLGGKKEYALNYGDEILSSLTFKETNNEYREVNLKYNKYSIELPTNSISENLDKKGRKLMQGYSTDGYFFVKETPVFDVDYIEEDNFEARYIVKAFLNKVELKESTGKLNSKNYSSYTSSTSLDSTTLKKLMLKSVVKDASYYLLGYVGKDTLRGQHFFNSLKFRAKQNKEGYKRVIDTSLYFSVVTNIKPPISFLNNYYRTKKVKDYDFKEKSSRYVSKSNEIVSVKRKKFHDLKMYESIDSLWNEIDVSYKAEQLLSGRKFRIKNKAKEHKDSIHLYSFVMTDSLSSKQILVKNILKKGTLFELKALRDSVGETPYFIDTFFKTFEPKDTLLGKSPLIDKVPQFVEAIKIKDSITHSLFTTVVFRKKDANALLDVLKNVSFSDKEEFRRNYLLKKLIELDGESSEVISFIKDLYTKSYTDPDVQITILSSLSKRNTSHSQELFLELLETDFPVSSESTIDFFGLISYDENLTSKKSLKIKKNLFPEILKYSSVQEYKAPIYKLLATLLKYDLVKPKIYRNYGDQIFNDARIELKRSFSGKSYARYSTSSNSLVRSYVRLLYPFIKENKVKTWFGKLIKSGEAKGLATYYHLLRKDRMSIPETLGDTIFNKGENIEALIDEIKNRDLLPKEFNREEIKIKYAKALLFSSSYNYDQLEIKLEKIIVEKFDKDKIEIYLFKSKNRNTFGNKNEELKYIAFKQKSGSIKLTPYYQHLSYGVNNNAKTDEELIKEAVDKIRYKNRKRLSDNRGVNTDLSIH